VVRDVRWEKVSREAAAADYGVVLTGPEDDPVADGEATGRLRGDLRAGPDARPFFDRGPRVWRAVRRADGRRGRLVLTRSLCPQTVAVIQGIALKSQCVLTGESHWGPGHTPAKKSAARHHRISKDVKPRISCH
jgi:hypothetical protein